MSPGREPIAIVGSSCRFPGNASTPSKLWQLLQTPHDVLGDFPSTRPNLKRFYNKDGERHVSTNVDRSYLLAEDHRVFDAAFFNINPLEAEAMDPRQRILLETVYEAMESGGHPLESMRGSQTAVYVGLMMADYHEIQLHDIESMPKYAATGTARSIISNRISYFFDLKGPSMTIDTACSSSLVAVHQAVQALRNGECSTAIVAGANLILGPHMYVAESKLHMLSPGSRSRMWDIDADGYARGEGLAAVILKTLSQALKDRDHIGAIVRETAVGSDGRTQGITMPSASAQASLIKQAYKNAGLDLSNKQHRCQYFEAHGTGTPTGDPIEAQAIRDAFFSPEIQDQIISVSETGKELFVGSIKTVIGHLEGCAGLAGLLKASLAIQNSIIPPNMHFRELNPSIQKFYNHLSVPTTAHPWPAVSGPRRASVNSFGFGGTNAHLILESFDSSDDTSGQKQTKGSAHVDKLLDDRFIGPLTFSANSESSLVANIKAFSSYLKTNDSINLLDLSWTMQSRRTNFPIKAAFSGATRERLISSMDTKVQQCEETAGVVIGTQSYLPSAHFEMPPGILGVFTGQGAQWASMGRSLVHTSIVFESSIDNLGNSLAGLPDPPTWSLKEELLADESSSRLKEAAISQPVCTAIQVALVDLLYHAGIKFDAVVGHSSGEIAAAYAAGVISSVDAIRIAYYRGCHAKLACGADGQPGLMMAVGVSFDDALEFCGRPQFAGRISVAASNAPLSVTLSGDADAIEEAHDIFMKNGAFSRLLKVDTAYHSHHMQACSAAYLRSLQACDIQINTPRDSCVWISSVRGDSSLCYEDLDLLKGQYWIDNMTNPVLFSEAIGRSMYDGGPFELAIEVGPHPALKGPTLQTIQDAMRASIPYCALLRRGDDAVEVFSEALGHIWAHLGAGAVEFEGYRRTFKIMDGLVPKLLTGLPSYSWDHAKVFWKESRISRNFHNRQSQSHELLGRRCADDSDNEIRWRNFLRLEELPWLRGHSFQGEALFPGAAYISMAAEASKVLSRGYPVELIEVENITIPRAMVIEENSSGVETVFTVRISQPKEFSKNRNIIDAEFTCYSCADESSGSLVVNCTGQLHLTLGEKSSQLPARDHITSPLNAIDVNKFYSSLSGVGLDYTALFQGIRSAKRSMHKANATASWLPSEGFDTTLMVHPALLDAGFQTVIASFSSPGNGSLWAPYLPTSIQSVRIDTTFCVRSAVDPIDASIDAYTRDSSAATICGDVNIYTSDTNAPAIQVDGLTLTSLSKASESNDRQLFSQVIWDADISSGMMNIEGHEEDSREDLELVELLERMAYFYMRNFYRIIPKEEIPTYAWYHQRFFESLDYQLPRLASGGDSTVNKEWLQDTLEQLLGMIAKFPGQIDAQLMQAVADNLVAVFQGKITMLEVMMKEGMLDRFYREGLGIPRCNDYVSRIMKQIAHRYPRIKILEIGGGTGGVTKSVLESIGDAFLSYTFTDISTGFFENAQQKFNNHSNKMIYKALDIEKDVLSQGYSEHSYDVIIAANVLHATRTLEETMKHTRSLLKPGGYLVIMEVTGDLLRVPFMMSGLTGWWLGGDDGRRLSPTISPFAWDALLRKTGFCGVQTMLPDMHNISKHTISVLISQAVDERINLIHTPLSAPELAPPVTQIIIVGGKTLQVLRLINYVQQLLQYWKSCIYVVDSIESLKLQRILPRSTVLCLTELDRPFFESLTAVKLSQLQQLFSTASHILWATQGALADCPLMNMTVGLGRSLRAEMPHLRLQLLDIEAYKNAAIDAQVLADCLMRLVMMDLPAMNDGDILWTTEPELVLKNEKLMIPRIFPDRLLNDRLNSTRREILKDISTEASAVSLEFSDAQCLLREGKPLGSFSPLPADRVAVQVEYSLLFPLRVVDETYLFLCLGTSLQTGESMLAFSTSNSSTIDVPRDWTCICEADAGRRPHLLRLVAAQLVAQNIVSCLQPNEVLLVHEPEPFLAIAIAQRAQEEGVQVEYTTSVKTTAHAWTYIHPLSLRRVIEGFVPSTTKIFIDFSDPGPGCVGAQLANSVPPTCKRYTSNAIYRAAGSTSITSEYQAGRALTAAFLKAEIPSPENGTFSVPDVHDAVGILGHTTGRNILSIVDWRRHRQLPVVVSPVNAKSMFSPDKTYLMVGLTGGLGLSICHWMAQNGARHFALASRTGKVDAEWQREMQSMGAVVKIYTMDVADKLSVLAVYTDICATMPPISGVANGAMVLRDKLFLNMSLEDMKAVLGPKVEGSRHLDEVFSDMHLDFFIMFSSSTSIIGNSGQSNYGAANMFMAALAHQRRKRGLAGSVIDLGVVTEIGYIARAGRALVDHLLNLQYTAIPEVDVHRVFAEAVVAGHAHSKHDPELIIGLQSVHSSVPKHARPPWVFNPQFSHLVREDGGSGKEQQHRAGPVHIMQQLQEVETPDEASTVLQRCFSAKLALMLQSPLDSINASIPLINLGVNPLRAVEIRSWFLKEINVYIPVLKVLGGASTAEICSDAIGKFWAQRSQEHEKTTATTTVTEMSRSLESANGTGDHIPELEVDTLRVVPSIKSEQAFIGRVRSE